MHIVIIDRIMFIPLMLYLVNLWANLKYYLLFKFNL